MTKAKDWLRCALFFGVMGWIIFNGATEFLAGHP